MGKKERASTSSNDSGFDSGISEFGGFLVTLMELHTEPVVISAIIAVIYMNKEKIEYLFNEAIYFIKSINLP